MEQAGYIILGIVAAGYFTAIIVGMIAAFPFGLIGLFILGGFGLLFAKALKDRLDNEEDDYYSRHIDQ